MSAAVEELQAKIRSLSADVRIELIRALIAELDGPTDAEVDFAWLQEAQRRHRQVVEGEVEPVPGSRVFENLRPRLKG